MIEQVKNISKNNFLIDDGDEKKNIVFKSDSKRLMNEIEWWNLSFSERIHGKLIDVMQELVYLYSGITGDVKIEPFGDKKQGFEFTDIDSNKYQVEFEYSDGTYMESSPEVQFSSNGITSTYEIKRCRDLLLSKVSLFDDDISFNWIYGEDWKKIDVECDNVNINLLISKNDSDSILPDDKMIEDGLRKAVTKSNTAIDVFESMKSILENSDISITFSNIINQTSFASYKDSKLDYYLKTIKLEKDKKITVELKNDGSITYALNNFVFDSEKISILNSTKKKLEKEKEYIKTIKDC